ncbi:hypothetical protein [Marinoscillum sp.]|uniref:hypothetical protein n=1 Tax=Marinoscillum sp. TaxID=2024838 RepID=UPI003BACE87E
MYLLKSISLFTLLSLLLSACIPSVSYFNWVAPDHDFKKFDNIAVFGLTRDLQDASDFEVAMVGQLRKNSYQSIPGMTIIPPEWMKDLDVKSIRKHLLSKGVDAVISLAIVDVSTRAIFVSGPTYIIPADRSRFGATYISTYKEIYQPDYYTQSSTFIYEAHAYDLTAEDVNNNLIWTYQYKYDAATPGVPQLSPFVRTLMDALQRDRIL